MQMPGRKYEPLTPYRYGFNGKENDNEIKGEGNEQDYGMRIYDPRLGRFLSADPLFKDYPFYTPYQFAGNTPIRAFDLDGLEITFSDVWNNRASIVDWINDPGTWTKGAKNINETINPIYQAYGHGYEIITRKDFNTGEFKGRGRAISDAGVNVMMWITGEKAFSVFRYENAVEKQMLKRSSAMGQAEKSVVQNEAQHATNAAQSNAALLSQKSVTKKLDEYLLNKSHPTGGTKANWFEKALGFTKENMQDLAKQIKFEATTAVETQTTKYGTKYNQVIPITGANGKTIDVTFAWIKNKDNVVRLITAIPTKQ
jgi:RHS repeat-associated protein